MKSFDSEWLDGSKDSLKFGVFHFVIPLIIVFWAIDAIYLPSQSGITLIIRLISIPLIYLSYRYTINSISLSTFFSRYCLMITLYSVILYSLIVLEASPNNLYFAGLHLISVGASTFIVLPPIAFFINNLIIYLPFILLTIVTGTIPYDQNSALVNLSISFCLVVILEFARRSNWSSKVADYKVRTALANLLDHKEVILKNMASDLNDLKTRYIEQSKNEEIHRLVRQIAHDIKSPLSAIQVCTSKIENSELAGLLKSSSDRIMSIAETVLKNSTSNLSTQSNCCDIIKTIDVLVGEFRFKFKNVVDIQLNAEIDNCNIKLSQIDFIRSLSILLNNSYEARKARSVIKINIVSKNIKSYLDQKETETNFDATYVLVEVLDNGIGIPNHILPNIGRYEFTFGKSNGNGIGLAYVKNVIELIGGSIYIDSKVNEYTSIRLLIPKAGSG